ncbi:peptidase C14, partial [Salmonella enterica subsp. enterica serovar Java]|nr:peptidase C14 [Salmonella enterica subsp. enterica serovar Java]
DNAREDLKDEVALAQQTLDAIAADDKKNYQIKLVDAGQPADIRLVVMRENEIRGAADKASDAPALWFLSATGDVEPNGKELPPLIQIHKDDPQKLAEATGANLEKIFRAVSLARLGSAMTGGISRVNVEFAVRRVRPDTMEPLRAAEVPTVHPKDEIHVVAKNDSQSNVDINILYIGSDYSITRIDAERLVPGAEMKKGLLYFSDTTFGMERMVAVLTAAPPLSAMEDLKYLEQGGVPPVTRGAGEQHGLQAMLGQIAKAPSTRAALALGGPTSNGAGAEGAVMMFPLRTQREP